MKSLMVSTLAAAGLTLASMAAMFAEQAAGQVLETGAGSASQ